ISLFHSSLIFTQHISGMFQNVLTRSKKSIGITFPLLYSLIQLCHFFSLVSFLFFIQADIFPDNFPACFQMPLFQLHFSLFFCTHFFPSLFSNFVLKSEAGTVIPAPSSQRWIIIIAKAQKKNQKFLWISIDNCTLCIYTVHIR